MSRRRSTGDLVPRDISEILAREARAQRGQKKSGSSLGQAFSWLKGSRKKKSIGNGLNRTAAGVTEAKVGLQNQEFAKAGPKGNEDQKRLAVHYTASQHYQENVFIEGSRPQYLEDLHTEAQEGLKIQQQEEHKNGVNFLDDESITSTDTLRPEQDVSTKDEEGSAESRSTFTDTTVTSTVSTRPVLTRQGSTFKPLNPVKRSDKSKKRTRRTTIMGIPNQVQKELALHRSSTFQQVVSTQLPNQNKQVTDSQSGVVIIPTLDGGTPVGNKEGARVHLSELDVSGDEQLLKKHLQAVYRDEQTFNHQSFGPQFGPSSALRPKSVAVPGMTTHSSLSPSMLSFLLEPQGPVMSISPQATYMSTIIPNAVLPASIEVIEIDRSSRTRVNSVHQGGSVRTVSKSSLASLDSSVSPMLSRRSDGDGSQTGNSFKNSATMTTSVSESNCSESQSSKTIISNSSPMSSKSSTHSLNSQISGHNGQESCIESGGDQDLSCLHSSVNTSSKSEHIVPCKESESSPSESVIAGEDGKNKQNCTRSLSIMKTKQPPAPPRRTNSLHCNKIRSNSRVQVDRQDLNGSASQVVATTTGSMAATDETKSVTADTLKIPTPVSNSTGSETPDVSTNSFSTTQVSSVEAPGTAEHLAELSSSSPQKTPSEGGKFDRTLSPSSGYSSQSGTPTLSPKGISPTSPDRQKTKPVKPERSMSRASSSAASPSSSLTSLSSGTSETLSPDISTCCTSPPPQESPRSVAPKELTQTLRVEVKELLNIPPPPKVKAPCAPPPETWVHNKQTFELLCGPCPVSKVIKKPIQIEDSTGKQAEHQTDATEELQPGPEEQTLDKAKANTSLDTLPEGVHQELEGRECPGTKQETLLVPEMTGLCVEIQIQEGTSIPVVKDPETTTKKDPPPVMKKPLTIQQREELIMTEQSVERESKELCSGTTTEVHSPVENNARPLENEVTVLVDKTKGEMDSVPSMQAQFDAPKMNKVSPPPTPPPAHHPTPPPLRKTPPSPVSIASDELHRVQEIHIVEPCWPPPPPPLESGSVFDGGDEIDFPPPPPPIMVDSVPYVMESCTIEMVHPNKPSVALEEVVESPSEAETSVQESPDVLPAATPTVVNDNPERVMQVLKENREEISGTPVQCVPSVTDTVQPLSNNRAESPLSVSTVASPHSFQKRDSLKIEDQSPSDQPINAPPPTITVPVAPPLPVENVTTGVSFRRQPSVAHRDARNKEFLARHKSAPIPKEDANIPLVTPSLLQMVRLRSVNMIEDYVNTPSEDKSINDGAPVQESCPASNPGNQNIPQKPIRKSLSLKSPPQTVKTSVMPNNPSVRLQEAIRMKTAAMSSRESLPCRLGMRSPPYNCVSETGILSLKSTEDFDVHKSPATTASFIFSRSTKKVVIETAVASSPEAQASLKQSLAAELTQLSDQSNAAACSNGRAKSERVPPPIARKPAHGCLSAPQNRPACSTKITVDGDNAIGAVQHTKETTHETTNTRVTADTIETLF
ncbi:NHS-like protein 3 isoform 2-T2 [Aulostomus maculatus]